MKASPLHPEVFGRIANEGQYHNKDQVAEIGSLLY
ncbi:hypothetical protein SAMN05428962_2761 [Paenibacillus sp. BC26]|nr:hypothetical protein SAMN05428962_2761 [Paenibacillus sp. BC26]